MAAIKNAELERTTILNAQTEHVILMDLDLRVIWANRAACESADTLLNDLIGRTCYSIWEQQDKTCEGCPILTAIRTGEPQDITKTTSDGRVWHIHGSPVRNAEGDVIRVVEVTEDITEQMQSQYALKESEERLRLTLKASNDGLFDLNVPDHSVFYSDRWFTLLGYEPNEFPGHYDSWKNLLHPEDVERSEKIIWNCIEAQESFEVEFRMRAKDGTYRWILSRGSCVQWDESGQPLRIVGTHTDITDRKMAEEERDRLAIAMEHTAECIIITDQERTIQYVNPAFERITGYSREEAIGNTSKMLQSEENPLEFYRIRRTTLDQGKVWRGRLTQKKKDGTLYDVEGTISPIPDSEGKISAYVSVVRDITDQLVAEKRVRQAQKMEAIGTLAGGIAHDFNNILSAIVGYCNILQDDIPADSPSQGDLDQVLAASNRAKDLVRQILAFSRQTEEERKPLRLHLVVQEALKLLRPSLPSTITIEDNLNKDCGYVLADATQMHQVVMNLATNAYHAMRAHGGRLHVILEPFAVDTEFVKQHSELKTGDHVRLTVSDEGYGIPKAYIERIFEPFFTTKERGEGTGMGLATVHGIINSHEGEITVYSEEGKGTTFQVYLPIIKRSRFQETVTEDNIHGGSEQILVLDDEISLVKLTSHALMKYGYQVTTVTDAEKALDMIRKDPNHFDLLFTDQTMPKMTGIDLAQKVLNIRPDMPIILTSGFSEFVSPEEARSYGFSAFLTKPTSFYNIAKTVREVLDKIRSQKVD